MRLCAVALLTGCATSATLGTARTLDKGATAPVFGSSVGWVESRPVQSPLGRVEFGVLHGLTDRVEVGAAVGGFVGPLVAGHAKVQTKLALSRPEPHLRGTDLAIAATFEVDGVNSHGNTGVAFTSQWPLLVGLRLRSGGSVVLGPRVVVQHVRSRGAAPVTKAFGGTSVGLALPFRQHTLMPQVAWLMSSNPADALVQAHTVQAGFGIRFGR